MTNEEIISAIIRPRTCVTYLARDLNNLEALPKKLSSPALFTYLQKRNLVEKIDGHYVATPKGLGYGFFDDLINNYIGEELYVVGISPKGQENLINDIIKDIKVIGREREDG